MSKKARGKRKPYAIYYRDGTYMIYDLTKADMEKLTEAFVGKIPAIISIGVLDTVEIRSIIEQKPAPVEIEKPANPPMPIDQLAWIYGQKEGDDSDGI